MAKSLQKVNIFGYRSATQNSSDQKMSHPGDCSAVIFLRREDNEITEQDLILIIRKTTTWNVFSCNEAR